MVNMIGFHHVEPRFNTASYGEEGWYCQVRPRPTVEHPLRARVATPCAHAGFNTPDDAYQFLNHPGDLPHMAKAYLAWATAKESPNA